MFAWRLLRDRLPTKDNLVLRQVLQPVDNVCVGGCGSLETVNHLFFGCDTFSSVWFLVFQWLGISFVAPLEAQNHFLQFGHLAGLSRSYHSFLSII